MKISIIDEKDVALWVTIDGEEAFRIAMDECGPMPSGRERNMVIHALKTGLTMLSEREPCHRCETSGKIATTIPNDIYIAPANSKDEPSRFVQIVCCDLCDGVGSFPIE